MEDDEDLDELLDEVEKKFCRDVSSTGRKEASGTGSATKRSATEPVGPIDDLTDDIDTFLEELLEDEDTSSQQVKRDVGAAHRPTPPSGGRKCCPVFVGGSCVTNGVGTSTSKRSCDQLRCVSCDFKVLMFDDREWDSSCDYLFLRNNMPERQRLGSKLNQRSGWRSYSCQCSWFSCCGSEPQNLRARPQLRWVCGKHHN